MLFNNLKYNWIWLISCQIQAYPAINSFGDSHAYFNFTNDNLGGEHTERSYFNSQYGAVLCRVNGFSGKTMYAFCRDGLNFLKLENCGVRENDVVIFAFGEMDVRIHICKQWKFHKRDLDEVIDDLLTRYEQNIKLQLSRFQNLICGVMSITPQTDQFSTASEAGTLIERIMVWHRVNQKLQEICRRNNYFFLDTRDLFADQFGVLISAKSDGNMHVHPKYNYLIKHRLINQLVEAGLIDLQ